MNALRRLWTGVVVAVPCAAFAVFVQLIGEFAFGWPIEFNVRVPTAIISVRCTDRSRMVRDIND